MDSKINPKGKGKQLTANSSLLRILAIPLAVGINTLFPLNQNPGIANQVTPKIDQIIAQSSEPETPPDLKVTPVNGTVQVKFTNTTNAAVFYQIIGQTSRLTLAANATITLEKLKLPASILFTRQNEGLLKVMLNRVSDGNVEVKLEDTKDLGLDRKSLAIRKDGSFFLR
jgi:hypothetical protein